MESRRRRVKSNTNSRACTHFQRTDERTSHHRSSRSSDKNVCPANGPGDNRSQESRDEHSIVVGACALCSPSTGRYGSSTRCVTNVVRDESTTKGTRTFLLSVARGRAGAGDSPQIGHFFNDSVTLHFCLRRRRDTTRQRRDADADVDALCRRGIHRSIRNTFA